MALKTIDADKNYVIKERPKNYYLGSFIREYVSSGRKLQLDPSVIIEIVEKFTKAGDGSDLHKVRFHSNVEVFLNDSGLSTLTS